MESGFSIEESMPVFISTDNFLKHKHKLRQLVAEVWQALRVVAVSCTPKAPATKRRLTSAEGVAGQTIVTSDPQHYIIKVRSLVSPGASDGQCFLFDYIDAIHRFSAEVKVATDADADEHVSTSSCLLYTSPSPRDTERS
eukprot:3740694-Karenia_brevis.AAC.1